MLGFVASKLEILNLAAAANAISQDLLDNTAEAIGSKVSQVQNLTSPDAKGLLEMIQGSRLPRPYQERISAAIVGRVCSDGGPAAYRPQVFNSLQQYLTAADWEALRGAASDEERILVIARRLVSLGCTHPTEPTVRDAVVLACCAAGGPLSLAADRCLLLVRDCKRKLKALAAGAQLTGPASYPTQPAQLKTAFPQVYLQAYGGEEHG